MRSRNESPPPRLDSPVEALGRGAVVTAVAAVVIAVSTVTVAAHPTFTIETVASQVGAFDIAVDSSSEAHLAVALDSDLVYGRRIDGSWVFESIFSTEPFYTSIPRVSITLDSQSRPHIAFMYAILTGARNHRLMYAVRDTGGWTVELVDSTYKAGLSASLALDSLDYPHVAYQASPTLAPVTPRLRYASRSGGGWVVETVDSLTLAGALELAIDGADVPHISYYDRTNTDLRYGVKSGGAWALSSVVTDGDVGVANAIAVDGTGAARIAFYDQTLGILKYSAWSGASWSTVVVDSTPRVGRWLDLALDGADRPRIAYTDSLQWDLRYAHFDGAWDVHAPDAHGNTGVSTRLDLEPNGNPQICYLDDSGSRELRYARVAPAGSGTIAGTVAASCDGSSEPVADIRVVLQLGAEPQDSMLTTAGGGYSFGPIPLGTYTIVTRPTPGFRPTPAETVVTMAGAGQTLVVDLGMNCRLFTIPVNLSNSATSARDPDIVLDADGGLFVAWGRDPEAVAYSSSLDDGATWSFPKDLPITARQPVLALADSNRLYLVMASFDSLAFRKSVDGGVQIEPASTTIEHQRVEFPTMAVASGGRIDIAWERYYPTPEGIYYSRSTDAGASFSMPDPIALNQPWPTDRHSWAKAVCSGDSVYLFWRYQRFSGPGNNRVMFSRSLNGGATFSTPVAISDTTTYVTFGDVQIDANGALHLLWLLSTYPETAAYVRSSDGGGTFQQVGQFTLPIGQLNGSPESLALSATGEVHAIVAANSGVWPNGYDLWYSRSPDGGVTWDPLENITNTPGLSDLATIRLDSSGTPVVVWRQEVAGAFEIYFSRKRP